MGNFNINFLPKPPYFNYKEELECQKGLDCKSLVDKPIRVSNEGKTKTLIDHITDDIADHYPIYCFIPKNDESKRSKRDREKNKKEGLVKEMEKLQI